MRQIIDTHTHLYDLADPAAVLREAYTAGVSDVVALGVDLESNRKHLELVDTRHTTHDTRELMTADDHVCHVSGVLCPHLHIALGLHPGNITPDEITQCFPFFRDVLAKHRAESIERRAGSREQGAQEAAPSGVSLGSRLSALRSNVVALGETGLDYWYKWVRKDEGKKREQREVFARHLALAREFNFPIVVHSRGAWRDCFDMAKASGVAKVEFHWYSGPEDVLKEILDAGFMISCTPSLAYSPEAQRAVRYAPLERILIETDTPVAYRIESVEHRAESRESPEPQAIASSSLSSMLYAPRPSTPKDVWRTLKLLSELKGKSEDEVLAIVNSNARNFFGL